MNLGKKISLNLNFKYEDMRWSQAMSIQIGYNFKYLKCYEFTDI